MTPPELKSIRGKLGLTQSQLASILGLRSKSHVSQLESGKKRISGPLALLMGVLSRHGVGILK